VENRGIFTQRSALEQQPVGGFLPGFRIGDAWGASARVGLGLIVVELPQR